MRTKNVVLLVPMLWLCTFFVPSPTDLKQRCLLRSPVPNGWPVLGKISSDYGIRRHPIWHRRVLHKGLDIKAPYASTVRATAAGIAEQAGFKNGYGRCVIVDHGFGWKSIYAHLSNISVKRGERVLDRQKIGSVGSSGHSTGPHLHYEVLYKNAPFNPGLFTAESDRPAISPLAGSFQKGSSRPR